MNGQHLDIDVETFERRLRREGWKYEYYNGQAHITSAQQTVVVRLDSGALPTTSSGPALGAEVTPWTDPGDELVEVAYAAFVDTMDYCDWTDDRKRENLDTAIRKWKEKHEAEEIKAATRLAWDAASGHLLGALLTTMDKRGEAAKLALLFVRPGAQREGIATALLLNACDALKEARERPTLRSAYALGNQPAEQWYRDAGFREEPCLSIAQHRRSIALHNVHCISPYARTGRVERARYAARLAHHEAQLAVLEHVASNTAAADTVYPLLSY